MITPDKILSYWILAWYVLFIFKFIDINPKFILIIGLLENIALLIIILTETDLVNIFYFIIIIFITKIIPILTVWQYPIRVSDIYYSGCIVLLYLTWVYITNSFYNPITTFVYSVKYNKPNTPGMILLHRIFDKYLYGRHSVTN